MCRDFLILIGGIFIDYLVTSLNNFSYALFSRSNVYSYKGVKLKQYVLYDTSESERDLLI